MNIKELMTDDISKVKEFADYCDEMINARYILAEAKIIKILQTVATSNVLQRVIGDSLKGFDYGLAAKEWSMGKVKPPFSPKYHVAFLFCVLADIDSKKMYLNDFLRKFFWEGDINSSYSGFVTTLLCPFRNYVVSFAYENNMGEQAVDNAQIDRRAAELAEAVQNHATFSQEEKERYILLCDGVAAKARVDVATAKTLAAELRILFNVLDLAPRVANLLYELGC